MDTRSQKVKIRNRFGLHMRPVAEISRLAYSFDAIVAFHKGDKIAHGHSVVEQTKRREYHRDVRGRSGCDRRGTVIVPTGHGRGDHVGPIRRHPGHGEQPRKQHRQSLQQRHRLSPATHGQAY